MAWYYPRTEKTSCGGGSYIKPLIGNGRGRKDGIVKTYDVEVAFFSEDKELYRKCYPVIAETELMAEIYVSNILLVMEFRNFRIISTKEVIQ